MELYLVLVKKYDYPPSMYNTNWLGLLSVVHLEGLVWNNVTNKPSSFSYWNNEGLSHLVNMIKL